MSPGERPLYDGEPIRFVDQYETLVDSGLDPYSVAAHFAIPYFDDDNPKAMYDLARGPRVLTGAVNYYTLVMDGGITGIFQNAPELTKLSIDAMDTLGFDEVAARSRDALGLFGLPEVFTWEDYEEASEKLDAEKADEWLDDIDQDIFDSKFDEHLGDRLHSFITRHRADFETRH